MALRSGHGKGGPAPRIEVLPVDELPDGVAAETRPVVARDTAGRILPGAGARRLGAVGGERTRTTRQLAKLMGLKSVPDDHPAAPYARLAREFRDAHMAELAASVGGGRVGAGAASIISSAALQMAASRWLTDEGLAHSSAKLLLDASRLADASRQNLLAAHELVAREAEARRRANPATGTIDFAARARQLKGSGDGT